MVSLEAISFSGPFGSIVEGSHTIRVPSRDAEMSMSPPPGRGLDRGRRAVTALVWPWLWHLAHTYASSTRVLVEASTL